MILKYLDTSELVATLKALEDGWNEASSKVSTKVLGLLEENSSQPSKEAWEQCSARVHNCASMRAAEKASQDTFTNALVDVLAAKLAVESLEAGQLKDLCRYRQIIARLTGLCLYPLTEKHLPWFKEIHHFNPKIKWSLGVTSDTLGLVDDPDLLGGLRGKLVVGLNSAESLPSLEKICEKCHTDLALEIAINATADVRIQHLEHRAPILKRLSKLTADLYGTDAPTLHGFRSLDRICECYTFKLALSIGDNSRLLKACTNVPGKLVDLETYSLANNYLPWLDEISMQSQLQVALHSLDNVHMVSNCTRSCWTLRKLAIVEFLETEGDISLFKQICKAHPSVEYDVTLRHACLLGSLLHNLTTEMRVLLLNNSFTTCTSPLGRGLEIKCELDCLRYLLGLDLSALTALELILSGDYEIDNTLIAAVIKQCTSLEVLKVDVNQQIASVSKSPVLHQKVHEIRQNLAVVTMANNPCMNLMPAPIINSTPERKSSFRQRMFMTGARAIGGTYLFLKMVFRK